MSYSQFEFDKAIQDVVSRIAVGHVIGYGEVARAAGFPRHARMVSKAMSRSSTPLPWHRVVRSDRTLAFAEGSHTYNKQKALLENEGVQFLKGKVITVAASETSDLDKLLWGPEDDERNP